MNTFTNACFTIVLLFFVFSVHAQNSMQFDAITVTATGLSSDEAGITVFPNPASQQVYIKTNGLNHDQIRITIQNVLGETITPAVNRNGDLLKLSLEGLENGIYFIRAEDGSAVFKQKISFYK